MATSVPVEVKEAAREFLREIAGLITRHDEPLLAVGQLDGAVWHFEMELLRRVGQVAEEFGIDRDEVAEEFGGELGEAYYEVVSCECDPLPRVGGKGSKKERAKAFKKAIRLNNAYARTLVGPDGFLPSREAGDLVAKHWLKVTKELRAGLGRSHRGQ